jgi:hypothetical protein
MTTSTEYTCAMTNQEWGMYTYDWEDGRAKERARSKRRGQSLSKKLTKKVRKALAELEAEPRLSPRKLAEQVRDEMIPWLDKYAEDGAADTEGSCALVGALEEAFGLERYSLDRY